MPATWFAARSWLPRGGCRRVFGCGLRRRLQAIALRTYAETDVFDEERRKTGAGKKRSVSAAFLSDLRDLKVGDLIVHVDHGIGQFVGLKQISVAGGDVVQEFLELRYFGDAKLFVPVERLDLIQKYTGGTKPPLDRLGGTSWERAKTQGQEGHARHGRRAAQALCGSQSGAWSRVRSRYALAGRVRGCIRVHADARSVHRDRRHQARHGIADADGSAVVR